MHPLPPKKMNLNIWNYVISQILSSTWRKNQFETNAKEKNVLKKANSYKTNDFMFKYLKLAIQNKNI